MDIRQSFLYLEVEISENRTDEAQHRARYHEIDRSLTKINVVTRRITGPASDGAERFLTKEQLAEMALRRPERVLLLNRAFVVILLIVGAAIIQFESLYAFPLLTGFVLSALVVLNAFYLRTIDKLDQESFMELIRLALLKLFAPLAGRQPKQDGDASSLKVPDPRSSSGRKP